MNLKINISALVIAAAIMPSAFADSVDIEMIRNVANQEQSKALVQLEPLMKGDYLENAEALFYYGRCLYVCKRYSAAKAPLEKALSLGLEGWQEDVAKSDLSIINAGPSVSMSSASRGGLRGYIGVRLEHNVVRAVLPGSPAEAAKILSGDVILAVNGADTTKMTDKDIVARLSGVVGDAVNLTILRGGKKYSSKVARAYAVPQLGEETVFQSQPASAKVGKPVKSVAISPASNPSDQSLVKVFRQTSETDVIKAQVLYAVSRIPRNIKDRFANAGVTILIVPTVLEARPDLAGQKPRGYDNGGGYDNCGGMYMPSDKIIYVAERYGVQNQPFRLNNSSYETALHESGHALDHLAYDTTRSDLSKTDDFVSVYKNEVDSISNSQRRGVEYFLQSEGAGAAELFAELFVAICDPNAKEGRSVVKTFPHTFGAMQKIVQQQ